MACRQKSVWQWIPLKEMVVYLCHNDSWIADHPPPRRCSRIADSNMGFLNCDGNYLLKLSLFPLLLVFVFTRSCVAIPYRYFINMWFVWYVCTGHFKPVMILCICINIKVDCTGRFNISISILHWSISQVFIGVS